VNQDSVAVLLYTSGTTAEPKAAVLRHRHLLAYVLNTLELASAEEGDAALVTVPPPGDEAGTPTLRNLAYGGWRTPRPVLERALEIFPQAGFVNAYGLTETASSVAVLGPDDHRKALASADPAVRERLSSVGRPPPGMEFQIRDDDNVPPPVGETGLVFVRGDQISGEYGTRSVLDVEGWFATRDRGRLDADGFLFIEGRADDTIIRGGENIAPAEIRQWVRERLRSSKTPDTVVFRAELPKTDTGKPLRRTLLAELNQRGLESTHA
jgi:acyl-CoA synthetase (AMP-forming)/AMP-acid ligase II